MIPIIKKAEKLQKRYISDDLDFLASKLKARLLGIPSINSLHTPPEQGRFPSKRASNKALLTWPCLQLQ